MRFIVREQPKERRRSSGQMRYEQDGRPTGAMETWRVSCPMTGYEVLRVDLDAQDAPSGHSYLYHLVRQENGRFERLGVRFWGSGITVEATLIFDEQGITGTRTVNGITYPVDAPGGTFWFPSSIGLGLLAGVSNTETAVTLNTNLSDPAAAFAIRTVDIATQWGDKTTLNTAGQAFAVRPFTIQWADQTRTLWLDEYNWPLKMARGDGLTAVETRYVRY